MLARLFTIFLCLIFLQGCSIVRAVGGAVNGAISGAAEGLGKGAKDDHTAMKKTGAWVKESVKETDEWIKENMW